MNKTLYVGNLPSVVEENQLRALFGAEGRRVSTVRILKDSRTGRSRGYAFIEMETAGDAQGAMDALNGREFLGRALAIDLARGPTRNEEDGAEDNLERRRARIRAIRSGTRH